MKTIVWFGFVLGALSAAGEVIRTSPGQKAIIKCGASSYTNYLKWTHGNNLITNVPVKGFTTKGSGGTAVRSQVKGTMLVISPVKEEDAGKFSCVADGNRQDHTLLVVSVSASPSAELQPSSKATLECQVKGLNQGHTVQWNRPDGSSHSGSSTVELNPVTLSDNGTWQCTFSHDGVTFHEDLVIKVQEPAPETAPPSPSQSPGGNQKPTCPNCVTKPPPTALLLGLSWWMWTAVGTGGLVVLLLIVFVIVLCKRNKRRKKRILKMKNSRQPLMPKNYCQCDRPAAAAKPQQGRRREKPSATPLPPLLMQ
ncbi:CD4-2 molecule, tandem duplicate 2 isoform X2 [Sebastes umbrosus]|uniref:CD4-2 molecule, tandem duplicate 2 isoform X2 n=1 Tax=Sebastes umbrosus TaxID=72105 RepID=UPI00189DC893|nr:CD4-2 molecule, tandem duplicate 2 isoform X2 [Sebastes umbrosus]